MPDLSAARAELAGLRGGLVVSCQSSPGNPVTGPDVMALFARAAVAGGAAGIRANGAADIAAIRAVVSVPIIGLNKMPAPDGGVFITPTGASAREVIAAGARLVALDATRRPRPGDETLTEVVAAIHADGALALADLATFADAAPALAAGVDAVGTTLSGYTGDAPASKEPDFALIAALASEYDVPVFAEGRIWTAAHAARARALGASFVVVGTAITNPMLTTAHFVAAITDGAG